MGRDESDNPVLRHWGDKPVFDGRPLEHWEVGAKLGALDFDRAAKLAGSRFAVLTGALSAAPSPQVADRSAEIRQQALFALHELREIGVTAVADSLRHLLSDPSVANLRQIVTFLKMPSTGAFANQVSALWAPVLDGYLRQPDPDGALRAAIPAQMTPLLSQLDAVLGAVNGLAATATVDNLNATVAMLSQPQAGPLGRKIAQPLQALLATITAPTGAATT